MLEPRPEIRTATRTRSAMMGGGPGGAAAPGLGRRPRRCSPWRLRRRGRSGTPSRPRRSSASITAAASASATIAAMPMPQLKVRAISPGSIFPCAWRKAISRGCGQASASISAWQSIGQHARDVLEQAAAGDMGERRDPAGADQRQQRLHIDAGRREQRLDQQPVLIEQGRAIELPALVRRQPADQREAVGMDAGRGEAEDDVARPSPARRSAPRRARPRRRRSRRDRNRPSAYMPGISAVSPPISAQPACRQPSAIAGDHPLGDRIVELRAGEIIEEEERLGALHDQIVGAHRDEVDADPVMPAAVDRELELGADAVIGGDQQRILVARRLGIEEAAEPAQARRPRRAAPSPWPAARSPSPARCRPRYRRPPWRRYRLPVRSCRRA